MNNVLKILAAVTGYEALKRSAIVIGIKIGAGAVAGIGAIFLLVAANEALSRWLGPIAGPIVLALIFFAIAGAIYASALAYARRPLPQETKPNETLKTSIKAVAAPALAYGARRSRGIVALGLLAAGFLVTRL